MRLSALLGTWTAWLALFPPEHAQPLGDLLLRLSPMLDPLRRRAGPEAVEPAGIGDIVLRGGYERLLISEWAIADAAPDEFIRRAGSGELLFTGPEPAHSEQSLRSVALFDAGPAQLGEARLVHMAMLILLARRAELAGARFEWGVLQRPGVLYDELGERGVRRLLEARTLAAPDGAALACWDALLDADGLDCWLIGDPDTPHPAAARARVGVRRSWLDAGLEVTLTQRRRIHSLALPLPAPADCIRLLRAPFDPPSKAGVGQRTAATHSLKRAPIFSSAGAWLAVAMVDASVTLYHLPNSLNTSPGRPRNGGKLRLADAIVAAGAFDKAFGALALADGALHPFGFPGRFFNRLGKATLTLPAPDAFEAVPGALRWAQAFFLQRNDGRAVTEQLLVLDKSARLVCWTRSSPASNTHRMTTDFRVVARNVIGAVQHGQRLLFAVGIRGRSDAYALGPGDTAPSHLYPLMHEGERFLFGELHTWRGGRGVYAMQLGADKWLVGDGIHAAEIPIGHGEEVLGCARLEPRKAPGLVLLERTRMRIALQLDGQRIALVDSPEPIARAAFDPLEDRLAWIGKTSTALTVRGLGSAQPLLRTVPQGGANVR